MYLRGIVNFLVNFAGIVAPIVAGIVADRVSFTPNFLITGGILNRRVKMFPDLACED